MDIVEVSLRRAMFKIPSETELSDEEVEVLSGQVMFRRNLGCVRLSLD